LAQRASVGSTEASASPPCARRCRRTDARKIMVRTSVRWGSGSCLPRKEVVPITLASSMIGPLRTSNRETTSQNVKPSMNASKARFVSTEEQLPHSAEMRTPSAD
jgi:hypothetical protein